MSHLVLPQWLPHLRPPSGRREMVCDQMAALVEKRLDDANHLQVRGAPLLLNRPFVMVFFVSPCAAPSPPLPSLLLWTRYPCIAVFLFEDHLFLYAHLFFAYAQHLGEIEPTRGRKGLSQKRRGDREGGGALPVVSVRLRLLLKGSPPR